jgi:hypothetical protein
LKAFSSSGFALVSQVSNHFHACVKLLKDQHVNKPIASAGADCVNISHAAGTARRLLLVSDLFEGRGGLSGLNEFSPAS